jgi:hypothetical protein
MQEAVLNDFGVFRHLMSHKVPKITRNINIFFLLAEKGVPPYPFAAKRPTPPPPFHTPLKRAIPPLNPPYIPLSPQKTVKTICHIMSHNNA